MSANSFNQNTKQLTIQRVSGDSSPVVYELAGTSWERRMSNDISDFSIPSLEDSVERKAQNLNQIQENNIFNALVSDEFVAKSSNNSGLSTKEEVESALKDLFESNTRINVQYVHVDIKGYMTEYNVEETAQNSNSVFRVDFNLLVAEPMSGGD